MVFSKVDFLHDAETFLADARDFDEDDLAGRMDLLRKLELLKQRLERPMDKMMNQWITLNVISALNVMVEMEVFEKFPLEANITAKELSSCTGLDEVVIVRLMRIIIAAGIVKETGENTYAHTPTSREYLRDRSADFFRLCPSMIPTYLSLPDYFKTHQPVDLYDPTKTPFSCANNSEGKTFYEVLRDDPEQGAMFGRSMKLQEPFLPTLGMFPFSSLQAEVEAERDRPFMVDIGGGRGHMLEIIHQDTEGGYGAKMILQDRPEVIQTISPDEIPGIERMAHDFFTPQPVKNAHIYYLRRILHNYQDETCVRILKNIVIAMGPQSRVMIGEVVLPSQVVVAGEMTGYWKDMVMLVIGGKERSAKEFEKILESAGMELVKVWPFKTGEQAVVEARLKRG